MRKVIVLALVFSFLSLGVIRNETSYATISTTLPDDNEDNREEESDPFPDTDF